MPPPRRRRPVRPSDTVAQFPTWVAPQLTKLVEHVPAGEEWAHGIKLDGYRIHRTIESGRSRSRSMELQKDCAQDVWSEARSISSAHSCVWKW
jgi:ATP-dependent DNA ligase